MQLTVFFKQLRARARCERLRDFNAKSRLQEVAQKTLDATPQYLLLDEKGPDHKKMWLFRETRVEILKK
jgi:dsRNA-specific ribonuclease